MPESTKLIRGYLENTRFQIGLLLLLVGLTFFVNLHYGNPTLMEARNFITAREMIENGNWLVPSMNGHLRLAKPPLPTWLTAMAGLGAGNIEDLVALRLPAAAVATLLVFFLYFLARLLTPDRLIPFLAAAILATSFSFINIGRQGTWDIYCHSFMLGAIWLLAKGCRKEITNYSLFTSCGIMLGLSFLSKGPVSFYALLLPFVIAYGYGFGFIALTAKWRGIVWAVVLCTLISISWPLYVYLIEPESLAHNVSAESTAWVSRHVEPIWFYVSFPVHTGIWFFFAVVVLIVPYARPRIQVYGNYRFLAAWFMVCILLLSLIPEKKERYLLPAFIPLALLMAHYVRYLFDSFTRPKMPRWDYWLTVASAGLVVLIAFAIPIIMYLFVYKTGLGSGLKLLLATILFIGLGIALLYFIQKKQFASLFLAMLFLHVSGLLVGIPLYQHLLRPNASYQSLKNSRQIKEIKPYRLYALDGMSPQNVWEVGRPVDTLHFVNQRLQLPGKLPAAVFSHTPLTQGNLPSSQYHLKEISTYHYHQRNPEKIYYLYLLTGNPVPAKEN